MQVELLTTRAEMEPYLNAVRAAADTARASFGFLPSVAYQEFAYQNRMVIAVKAVTRELAGYVLYGGALPQGRIFQTWTAPNARGQGVGRRLIQEVVQRLERLQYLSVRADVADDLAEARSFYSHLGFDVVRTRAGKTAGRSISVCVRELATPSLLDFTVEEGEGLSRLPLSVPSGARAPLYVLDLNVLFDVARQRPRAASATRVMTTAFENHVRLVVTSELVSELERHTRLGETDPILAFASSLPRLPVPSASARAQSVTELAQLVFPDRTRDGCLTVQDQSDLIHLSTAIQECAAGFVTSEKCILRASNDLQQRYGLEIISPEAFGSNFEVQKPGKVVIKILAGQATVSAQEVTEIDHEELETFLRSFLLNSHETRALLACGTQTATRRRHLVRVDGGVAAFGAWEPPRVSGGERELHIFADEAQRSIPLACEHLLRRALADTGPFPPAVYRLRLRAGQSSLRRAAIANGFFRMEGTSPRSEVLQKVAVGQVVSSGNWQAVRENLRIKVGLALPVEPPRYLSPVQLIEITNVAGETTSIALPDLERLLSPIMMLLPNRDGVVFPITQSYAEDLFRGSTQPSFLSDRPAALRTTRGYVGGAATYRTIPEGGLAVFYESSTGGGRSAATAVARITRKYLLNKPSAARISLEKGVLAANAIGTIGRGNSVALTEFEDLMLFKKPVSLADLRSIGCVDASNFVTARSISDAHLEAIMRAGSPHA